MHDTAFQIAGKFFQLYWRPGNQLIVELGSSSINGSLRDHQPPGSRYIGLDIKEGPSVDVIIDNSLNLPIADSEADCVISSSTFEHDKFFWQTFLELCRITKPGGFIYLNSPSNGEFHRYPSDYWRFYPDAGRGLEEWATTSGIKVTLVESFIAGRIGDQWNDFVAIFQRGEAEPRKDGEFLYNHFACQNIHRFNVEQIVGFERRTQDMQLLAEARASAEPAVNLKEQLSDLHQQVNKLYQVAIQCESLQQDHIVLQNQNENNSRLLAARDETLKLSEAATAQAFVERERERDLVEKLTARVHELTTQLHSVQQDALRVTRELAAREREFAEKLAAKDRESDAQLCALQQELLSATQKVATRERESAEKLLSRENALGIELTALRLEATQLSRALVGSEATISSLSQAALTNDGQISGLKEHIASLTALAAAGEAHRLGLNNVIAERNAQIMQIGRIIAERDSRIAELHEELGAIYRGIWWRLAAPLRKVGSWFGAKNAYPKFAAAAPQQPDDSPLPVSSDAPKRTTSNL